MRMVFDYHISYNGFLRMKADLCLVEKLWLMFSLYLQK